MKAIHVAYTAPPPPLWQSQRGRCQIDSEVSAGGNPDGALITIAAERLCCTVDENAKAQNTDKI